MITNMMHKALSGLSNWWQGDPEPRNPMKYIDLTQNDKRWVPYTPEVPPCCPDCDNPLQWIEYGYPIVSADGVFGNYYSGGCVVQPWQWICHKCPAYIYFEGHELAPMKHHKWELANRPLTQLDFWTDLESYISEHGSLFKNVKPRAQRWIDIGIGKTGVKLRTTISYDTGTRYPSTAKAPQALKVELYFYGPKARERFSSLFGRSQQIENDLQRSLLWLWPERSSVCRISSVAEIYLDEKNNWPSHISDLVEDLNDFYQYFRPIVREL